MRILSLCDGFLPNALGGVEVLSYHQLKRIRARGHELLILTSRIDQELAGPQTYDGLDLVKIKFNESLASHDLKIIQHTRDHITALVRDFAPDVIHLNDARPSGFFFLRGGPTANLPRVLTLHSPIREPGRDGLQNRLVAEADKVIAVSYAQQADLFATVPAAKDKTTVIHNALPMPSLEPLPLPFAPPLLLCVGRVVPEKGFDVALKAVASLAERGMRLDLAVAGNGSEMFALDALARERGIEDQLRFLDWVRPGDVPSLMNTATLVLMPSRWQEPFGLVALQAQQMARPVLASDVGGLREVVAHGETGYLLPPDDVAAWTNAIAAMLSDPAAAQRMGNDGRRQVQEKFDFEAFVLSHEQIFADAWRAAQSAIVVMGA